jgi:peptidoglycan/LPS O-acetylase OafA/YrhL
VSAAAADPKPSLYQSLQGGRAIAAALVVAFHLCGTFAQDKYFGTEVFRFFGWGDAGVDFFFVLSGFLITTVHRRDLGHPRALGNYLFKRTLRVYPTYWLICLAVSVAAVVVPSLRQALPGDLATYLVALTLVPMDPAVVGGTGSPILFVAWSLQYEMLFYALVAAAILNRALGAVLAAAVLGVILSCHWGATCTFPASFLAKDVYLFAFGVVTAIVARSGLRIPFPAVLACVASAAFVAFGAFEVFAGQGAPAIDRRAIYGIISAFAILGFVRAEDDGSLVLRHRWLPLLGDSSYALYLIHIPVISTLVKLFSHRGIEGGLALHAVYLLIFGACVAAAVCFHLAIEKPMLKWLRAKLGGRWTRRPSANVGAIA